MSLLAPVIEFLLQAHEQQPIAGDVLFLGKQDVVSDLYVSDKDFVMSLGARSFNCMDVSDYEGANIIWDLGYPVPESLHGKFDFIYDGGCLDNMFNPAQAMMNFTAMLKPGGRIVCMESASSFSSAYLMYSPGWFFDYYAVNGFDDCKVYVCSHKNAQELMHGPWKVYEYDFTANRNGSLPTGGNVVLLTIARKGSASTYDRQPLQYQYRDGASDHMPASSLIHRRPVYLKPSSDLGSKPVLPKDKGWRAFHIKTMDSFSFMGITFGLLSGLTKGGRMVITLVVAGKNWAKAVQL